MEDGRSTRLVGVAVRRCPLRVVPLHGRDLLVRSEMGHGASAALFAS